MEPLNICIATQTPLFQFTGGNAPGRRPPTGPVRLATLREGTDYRLSPGGVTRMVYPLVRRMLELGHWSHVDWVALNPSAPATVELPGLTLHHVRLEPPQLAGYGRAKETLWTTVHGLRPAREARELFWTDNYGEYTFFNRRTAELISELDATRDFDAFYLHDFQLLPLGGMLRSLKPKVFRWHIPFDPATIPARWGPVVRQHLAAYDVVVVSSERYAEALRQFGYEGRTVRIFPFVDPADYSVPPPAEVEQVARAKGIGPSDRVILVVARMDPAKRQDRVIEAFAGLPARFRSYRLVLVGNGSFSGGQAGLGLSKGAAWRRHLEETADRMDVRERVLFTGHVTQTELDSLYERAEFTVLPSGREGFGLVVVESWMHGRPAVVCRDAGVADLVRDGENGMLFDDAEPGSMRRAIERLMGLGARDRRRMGDGARSSAETCSVEHALRSEARLLGEPLEA